MKRELVRLEELAATLSAEQTLALRGLIVRVEGVIDAVAPAFPPDDPKADRLAEAVKDLLMAGLFASMKPGNTLEKIKGRALEQLRELPALRGLLGDLLGRLAA